MQQLEIMHRLQHEGCAYDGFLRVSNARYRPLYVRQACEKMEALNELDWAPIRLQQTYKCWANAHEINTVAHGKLFIEHEIT